MTKARDNANGGAGLILVKPTSVSAGATDNGKGTISFTTQSSVSLNGVFTSTYTNYKIVFGNLIGSANAVLKIRWRKAGSDNTSSIYYSGAHYTGWNAATGVATNDAAATSAGLFGLPTTWGKLVMDISQPLTRPMVTGMAMTAGPEDKGVYFSSFINTSDTFDGITFFPVSGTITGSLSVYGYNK